MFHTCEAGWSEGEPLVIGGVPPQAPHMHVRAAYQADLLVQVREIIPLGLEADELTDGDQAWRVKQGAAREAHVRTLCTVYSSGVHTHSVHPCTPVAAENLGQHLCLWKAQPCERAKAVQQVGHVFQVPSNKQAKLRTQQAACLLGSCVLFLLLAGLLGALGRPAHLRTHKCSPALMASAH